MPETSDPRLVYVYDALCGWCYGFSPTLKAFAKTHDATVDVVSGGMIRGPRIGMLSQVAPYIRTAYKDVEQRTGVKFGQGFLDVLMNGDVYMTSEPAAALLSWVKDVAPARQLEAAHELQRGVYYHGHGPDSDDLARNLADELGLDADAAVAARTDPKYAAAAEADFALSQQLGVRGFPAVFVQREGGLVMIANGYTDLQTLEARFAQANNQ